MEWFDFIPKFMLEARKKWKIERKFGGGVRQQIFILLP